MWTPCRLLLITIALASPLTPAQGEKKTWNFPVQPVSPGNFPLPPDFRATFEFGWSELPAAEAKATVRRKGKTVEVEVRGGTRGWVRTLWKLDARHRTVFGVENLDTKSFHQVEEYARKTLTTDAEFRKDGLWRLRRRTPDGGPSKWKRIPVQPVEGVVAAMFGIRSQSLQNGQTITTVAFPGDAAFIVQAKVEGREKIKTPAGEFPAIRMSFDLQRIVIKKGKSPRLEPHGKFRKGTVWLSDDEFRIPLRTEVHIFIGYVYGVLKTWERT